jgi:hypothetical protein
LILETQTMELNEQVVAPGEDPYAAVRDQKLPQNIMQELEALAHRFMREDAEVARQTEVLKEVTAIRNKTRFHHMPELMKLAGNLKEYKLELPTGEVAVFEREKDPSSALSKGNRDFVLKFMKDNGYGPLLTNDVTLPFNAGQEAELAAARAKLDEAGLAYSVEETVQSSRYSAWCARMIDAGKITVDQYGLFGIHVVEQVSFKVKAKKVKKSKRSAE